jgi:hypothetical protein
MGSRRSANIGPPNSLCGVTKSPNFVVADGVEDLALIGATIDAISGAAWDFESFDAFPSVARTNCASPPRKQLSCRRCSWSGSPSRPQENIARLQDAEVGDHPPAQ